MPSWRVYTVHNTRQVVCLRKRNTKDNENIEIMAVEDFIGANIRCCPVTIYNFTVLAAAALYIIMTVLSIQ